MSTLSSSLRRAALLSSVCVLAACGGRSGGADDASGPAPTAAANGAPAAPVLALTPQAIKNFHFTWSDVSGETRYALLEDPDGSSGYSKVADIAADATQHDLEVSLPSRINARYRLQACNAVGCTDSATVSVTGTLAESVGYVKASNTRDDTYFGYSVAVSRDGSTLAVGAIGEDSNATGVDGDQSNRALFQAGAVYVFARQGTTWAQQAYVKASNTGLNDQFGFRVALSTNGDTLAVSAPFEDGNGTAQSDNSALDSGAVYLFTRNAGVWGQQAYVKAATPGASDLFGFGLALSGNGDTLAVGAHGEDGGAVGVHPATDGASAVVQTDNSAADSGAAYVFTRTGGAWSQQAYIKASNAGVNDAFGVSAALSEDGNLLAVGAQGEASTGAQNDNSAANSGAAYVFASQSGTWTQQAYLKASNPEAGDAFGNAIALSGDGSTLAVAAPQEDSNGTDGPANNGALASGAVYVFHFDGVGWPQQAYLKAVRPDGDDQFGIAMALSNDGNTLVATAYHEQGSARGLRGDANAVDSPATGAAYTFARRGGSWSLQAYVKAADTPSDTSDMFGISAALSGDALTLAIGAYRESGASTGVGGDQSDNVPTGNSGAVYLY